MLAQMIEILQVISVPVTMCSLVMLILVVIDMSSGIYASCKHDIPIESRLMRKTIEKLIRYTGLQITGAAIDVLILLSQLTTIAYATLLFTLMNAIIELYSIWENYKKATGKLPSDKFMEFLNTIKDNKDNLNEIKDILKS